jgi:flagellar basal-body rod protein FlgB
MGWKNLPTEQDNIILITGYGSWEGARQVRHVNCIFYRMYVHSNDIRSMKLIENAQIKLLSHAMDAYSLRQKMTAANIANIDTPGYKRKTVSFEKQLQQAEKMPLADHSPAQVEPRIDQTDEDPVLENEMMTMADTQMRVQLVTRALKENFDQLRAGITGRSR